MRIVDRLRQLDERVGLSAAPPRWHGGGDPPRWARAVASRRVPMAVLLGGSGGSFLALLWTLTDPSFALSNLLARALLVIPVTFLASALVIASVTDRVELDDRDPGSEVERRRREG